MKKAPPFGRRSSLVFCDAAVDPAVVTHTLGVAPSFEQSVGEIAEYWNGHERASQLGTWKLTLSDDFEIEPVETQIRHWLPLLEAKATQLSKLVDSGYHPYLDCPGNSEDLSVYLEPALLLRLANLRIGLSIWLYAPPSEAEIQ